MHKECAIVIPNLELVAPVAFGRDNQNTTVQFLDIVHLALPKRMLKKSPSRCREQPELFVGEMRAGFKSLR